MAADYDDDVTRCAVVQLNMHCITKEMIASHVLKFMPSMAGEKLALLIASSHTTDKVFSRDRLNEPLFPLLIPRCSA